MLSGQEFELLPTLTRWLTGANSITSEGIKMKKCTKCGETKPAAEFYKQAGTRDKLDPWCKACHIEYRAKWNSANNTKLRSHNAAYRAANSAERKAYNAAYRSANSEKIRVANAAYRAANVSRKCESDAKYRAANPEKRRINDQNRNARKRESGGKLSHGLAAKLFKLQRGKCPCCGKPLGNDFHLDHRMPIALGGMNIDDNIQLLHSKCNLQKGIKHPAEFMRQRGFLL